MKCTFISNNDEYMKPVILIKKDKSELLTNSSLCLIKGETGSGKSRLAMNIMVGLSGVDESLDFQYAKCPEDKHVVYISTEMSRYHLQKRLKAILAKTGLEYEKNLRFVDFMGIDDKIGELKQLCEELNPYIIIIDQIGDFVLNINDIEQCIKLVNQLANGLEKNDCAIIGILHQNEDSGINSKARGHLGSILEQKVVSSIAISANSSGFNIKTTKLREGIPIQMNAEFDEETEMLKIKNKDNTSIVDKLTLPCNASDLDSQICKLTSKAITTARSIKKDLLNKGVLVVEKEGKFEVFKKNETPQA